MRSLFRSPGFTAIAVLTLALGIGASTAIFSVVHAVLLSPLRYTDSAALVQIRSAHPEQGQSALAPATFGDVAARSRSFSVVAAQTLYYYNLTKIGTAARVTGVQATADYFKLWGVQPLLGRTWRDDEARVAAAPVVVLSESVWRRHYGANPALLGQPIWIDDVAVTVIGVMPAWFSDPWGNGTLWRPIPSDGDTARDRTSRFWGTYARLRPGVTLAQANAELGPLAAGLVASAPDHYRGWTLVASDLQRAVVGDYRTGLLVVLGAVACVMLITCANVAGLNVVRATARRKELALRTALGASRGQLLRELLGESLLLAALGGLGGLLLGSWGIDALLASLPSGWLPRADEIDLDGPVLAAAFLLTLVTGLAFGLAPGFTAARVDAAEALKDNARASASPSARRLRSALVVTEIALAFILLVAAGLLVRSWLALLDQPAGFDAPRVLSLTVSLSETRYDTPEKRRAFYDRALAEVAGVPGVAAAGFTHTSPFRWGIPLTLVAVGRDGTAAEANVPQTFYDSVSPDYFRAAGIPLLSGRLFNATDRAGSPPVVLLGATAARRLFGTEDPVGRSVTNGPGGTARFEVVGVVGDVRRNGLATDAPLQAYRPLDQRPTAFATLMVRTTLRPAGLAPAVTAALARVDPETPVSDLAPMAEIVSRGVTQPRLYLTLFSLFAGLALLLSALGLYGLVAYSVAQRTREFGIRAALGASPRAVVTQVLRESTALIALGLGLGLVGALLAARFLNDLVFATSVHDPAVFVIVPLLLAGTALLACLIPARRAMRVDPLVALRAE